MHNRTYREYKMDRMEYELCVENTSLNRVLFVVSSFVFALST